MKQKNKYLSFLIIFFIVIGIYNVSAFFPATYKDSVQKRWLESCVHQTQDLISHPIKENFWCRWFGIGCKLINECNLNIIFKCNQDNPKNYSCMRDIERECYRSCLNNSLEFEELKQHLFENSDCFCKDKEGNIILKGDSFF